MRAANFSHASPRPSAARYAAQLAEVLRGFLQGAKRLARAVEAQVGLVEGPDRQKRHAGSAGDRRVVRTALPRVSSDQVIGAGEPDEHAGEHAVVPACEARRDEDQAERDGAAGSRVVDHAMRRQHREWQAGRHHQLDVRRARVDERAEGEQHRRHRARLAASGEVAAQIVRAGARQDEGQQDGGVVGGVRVPGEPVRRHRQHSGTNVRFGIRERARVGVEDVCVEEVRGGGEERVRDPRHVPDAELAVARVDSPEGAEAECQRIGHHHRQYGRSRHDDGCLDGSPGAHGRQ